MSEFEPVEFGTPEAAETREMNETLRELAR